MFLNLTVPFHSSGKIPYTLSEIVGKIKIVQSQNVAHTELSDHCQKF